MKTKIYTFAAAIIVLANLANISFAETRRQKTAAQTSRIVAKLPASDAAAQIDLKRLTGTALPQILNARPETLADVNAKIDQIKAQTGIDLRQFDQLAVGLKFQSEQSAGIRGVALASGSYDMNALLAAMKLVAKDKVREEKSGTKTIYIFTPKDVAPNLSLPSITIPGIGVVLDFNRIFSDEMAITALDKNTLAFGNPQSVRETLESKARIGQNILALVNRNPNAVISFGGNTPTGLAQFVSLGDDDLGKNLASIRQIFGAMNVADGSATVSLTAKTTTVQQATNLEETVTGLQMLGKSLLGGMKGADKAVYARLAENAKITRTADEVNLAAQIPQSDIDILVGKK